METMWAMAAVWMALLWAVLKWSGVLGSGRAAATWKRKSQADARKHFMAGAQLLARARKQQGEGEGGEGDEGEGEGNGKKKKSKSLARQAMEECNVAISLDPRDAAAHIVKALALEHLGHMNAAIRCLTTALSPPAVRSLSDSEKADALLKRASMNLSAFKGNKRANRAAIADLEACLSLLTTANDAARCYRMLATCYRRLGMVGEAEQAAASAVESESAASAKSS